MHAVLVSLSMRAAVSVLEFFACRSVNACADFELHNYFPKIYFLIVLCMCVVEDV